MIKTISLTDFLWAFQTARPDDFTYPALRALFENYEQIEAETNDPIELDVIAICCDWTESTEHEIRQNYDIDETISVEDYLFTNTPFITLENGNILYINF